MGLEEAEGLSNDSVGIYTMERDFTKSEKHGCDSGVDC
jgi:hypothetical protein